MDPFAFGVGVDEVFAFVFGARFIGDPEADFGLAESTADDVVEPDECATDDEEDIGGIELDVLLFGVLASALGWDIGNGAFDHFEQ